MAYRLLSTDPPLKAGEFLLAPGGHYSLWMQPDGNVVLYPQPDPIPGTARWDTKTTEFGNATCVLSMKNNGKLLVLLGTGQQLWHSQSNALPTGPYWLNVQDDGNVVVYHGTPEAPGHAVWSWKSGPITQHSQ